jgi:hypothetical protein
MKSACALAAVAMCAFAGGATDARAAETPARFRVKSFAEVMPSTTIFFLEIMDYARARTAYRTTPRWKLWWEGAGREFIGKLGGGNDAGLLEALRAFAESAKIPTGKVAFAIQDPDPQGGAGIPMSIFLAEVGGRVGELSDHLRKIWGIGFVRGKQEFKAGGVRFEEKGGLILGADGGLLMGGTGKSGLNDLVTRFAERPWQNLAGNPAYRLAKSRALEGAHFMTFTNYTDIWRMLAMELDEDWLPVERTGLPQLAATSLSGKFTPEGVIDKVSFILRGRARGIWKLLRPEALTRKAWKFLPDFTSGFVAMRLPDRTQPFLDLLRAIEPEIADEFVEGFREFREETGFDFGKDFVRLTTGEFTFVFLDEEPKRKPKTPPDRRRGMMMGEEKLMRHIVLLVELKDPAKARSALDSITAIDAGGGRRLGTKRRVGDHEFWTFGDEGAGSIYISGSGGIGMIALSHEPIRRIAEHIAKRGEMLVDSAKFIKASRWFPADTGFAAYSDVRKIMKGFHALMSYEMSTVRRPPGDLDKLPKADALLEDLTPLTACMKIEKPGFALEVHSPDGIYPFYFQLMAHCFWRIEGEQMEARRKERARRRANLPPTPSAFAGVDPKIAKAYADVSKRIARIKNPQLKIAELLRAKEEFAGTPYERILDALIVREKTRMVGKSYAALRKRLTRIKTGQLKVAELERAKPTFAGTSYARVIDVMIKREKAMIAKENALRERARARDELQPVDDVDDVF